MQASDAPVVPAIAFETDPSRYQHWRLSIEPPLGLRRGAEAACEADLAERRVSLLDGDAARRGGDGERDR